MNSANMCDLIFSQNSVRYYWIFFTHVCPDLVQTNYKILVQMLLYIISNYDPVDLESKCTFTEVFVRSGCLRKYEVRRNPKRDSMEKYFCQSGFVRNICLILVLSFEGRTRLLAALIF